MSSSEKSPPSVTGKAPPSFDPIAVVGRSCLLPGAHSPEQLWQAVAEGRDLLSTTPPGRWGLPAERALCSPDQPDPDRSWSDRGGYVSGFDEIWDPQGFAVPASELDGLDPLFHWLLHCAREALRDAGRDGGADCGAVFGNLGFPSVGMAAYAQSVWLGENDVDPRNREMSGGAAELLQKAFNLGRGSHALDAACASGLYAIKLACDRLQSGEADCMLAGAVQCADDLFLHVGFCALNAMSRSGRSRPFHRDADGLVPAEGAAFVVLKRLADARRDGDTIHAIIRGVGLSNDGRGKGLLAPAEEGQLRAMQSAYRQSAIAPASVSLLECHATGTPVGDATELRSSARAFESAKDLPIGSLKSNLGHLITSAGIAGLIKVIEAMRHRQRPPTLHADSVSDALSDTPFRLLQQLEDWPAEGPRIAALSAFGFGGNNAHLILSEDDPVLPTPAPQDNQEVLAIVGLGALAAGVGNRAELAVRLFAADATPVSLDAPGRMALLSLDLAALRFPPLDLKRALPQQLAVLESTREALLEVKAVARDRAGVVIGMEPDPEVARYGSRWRLAPQADGWIEPLNAAAVVGCMPNIPANRISAQFDFGGLAFTVQAGSASGAVALQIAANALRRGELDLVVVAAVDFSCEVVQQSLQPSLPAGDAAITLVLKRLSQARHDGDRIYAILGETQASASSQALPQIVASGADSDVEPEVTQLHDRFGHSNAASGLLHIAAAALMLHHRRLPGGAPWMQSLPAGHDIDPTLGPRRVEVAVGNRSSVRLLEAGEQPCWHEQPLPRLHCYAGADKQALITALHSGTESREGAARLVLIADHSDFESLRTRALAHLIHGQPAGRRIHFRDQPIGGELAFAFTSAGGCHPQMGSVMLQRFPHLLNGLAARSRHLATALHWCNGPDSTLPDADGQLWAASALCQLHREFSQQLLGMQPSAWLGYSSGETNALFASGVWQNPDQLIEASRESLMMQHWLGERFQAAAQSWQSDQSIDWCNWSVLAPLDDTRAAIADLPRVHLAIIHSDNDAVIGGDDAQCRVAIQRLGAARCQQLPYPLVIHVPEFAPMAEPWYRLHHRVSTPLADGQRLYSNAFGRSYLASADDCAQSLLDQAGTTLDLRPAILAAWNDGARVFVEHGPGSTYGRAIRSTLGEREALVVSLDRPGQKLEDLLGAVAALWVAGVDVDLDALARALPEARRRPAPERELLIPAHPAPVSVPRSEAPATLKAAGTSPSIAHPQAATKMSSDPITMIPAPKLAPVLGPRPSAPRTLPQSAADTVAVRHSAAQAQASVASPTADLSRGTDLPLAATPGISGQLADLFQRVSQLHQQHLQTQQQLHQRFLSLRGQTTEQLLTRMRSPIAAVGPAVSQLAADSGQLPAQLRAEPVPPSAAVLHSDATPAKSTGESAIARALGLAPTAPAASQPASKSALAPANGSTEAGSTTMSPAIARALGLNPQAAVPVAETTARANAVVPHPASRQAQSAPAHSDKPYRTADRAPASGPSFRREQLQIHASGRISEVFGPEFSFQDQFRRQVRMPEPPLLLADRVTGIEGEALVMGPGRITTETDVSEDAWYLHHRHMPGGVMIEAGQADLMLISWQGIDRYNRSERVYRLLGCELTYHGDLPKVGDTLSFDIHLDAHASQDDIRLMFFHYDCHNGERLQLSVRGGQAGFFSDAELADSAGCLWRAEEQKLVEPARLDPPDVSCTRSAFDRAALEAFAAGDSASCLGAGFEFAATHSRSPSIHGGRMLLQHRISEISARGGPWQRGYLRAELDIDPEHWFFAGHFHNDPCMPGTLMFEGCLQMMAFHLAWNGYTLRRDGWRFQPVPELPYALQCRGQVTPRSRRLVTEVFVEEIIAGPIPTVYADLLCTVDGLKAFHARRVAVQLVPDWPMDPRTRSEDHSNAHPVAVVDGLRLDQRSLLASAMGQPSEAFGDMYRRFDGPMRVARLPSPPYLFVSRVREVHGQIGQMKSGARTVIDYDIPENVWYFDDNGSPQMPFAVLLEAALQPCGWLSSYVGSTLSSDEELSFRNLDGEGRILAELTPGCGTLQTEVTLTRVSAAGDMIIEAFDVLCRLGGRDVYRLKTVFGFFPPEALAAQKGLPADARHDALLSRSADNAIALETEDHALQGPTRPQLGQGRLRMIDRIEGHWPGDSADELGSIRTSRAVSPSDWFFKAHFFQDPVQPGSLGLEAMVQTLQAWMLLNDMDRDIERPRFQSLSVNSDHRWRYRGQVLPHHQRLSVTLQVTASGRDPGSVWARANASLWVDGQRIYEASDLSVHIVSG